MRKFMIFGGIGCLVFAVIGAIFLVCTGIWGVGVANDETRLHNLITAKQRDNANEYDNCWKSIAQASQVTEAQAKALTDMAVNYAQARTGAGGHGSMIDVKAVHEVVPNMDSSTFNNLMNIITSKRDGFAQRQKELLDYNREHENLLTVFPGSIVCGILGRKSIDIKIVTSSRTEKAFDSQKDDDISVFQKK